MATATSPGTEAIVGMSEQDARTVLGRKNKTLRVVERNGRKGFVDAMLDHDRVDVAVRNGVVERIVRPAGTA